MEYMLFIATDTEPDATDEPTSTSGSREGERADPHPRRRAAAARGRHDRRVRDGQVLVTDGPYTESKEWIVGYDLLECGDLDQAIDYVSRHPMAYHGRIEIRPVATTGRVTARPPTAVARRTHQDGWARIVAGVIRITGDWALAEDATATPSPRPLVAGEATASPTNPAAWLA